MYPNNTHVVVVDSSSRRVSTFTLQGAHVQELGQGVLGAPTAVAFAANGDVLVADPERSCVCVFAGGDSCELVRTIPCDKAPRHIAVAGHMYLLDSRNNVTVTD